MLGGEGRSIETYAENGVTRKKYRHGGTLSRPLFYTNSIPIPGANKAFYASFRFQWFGPWYDGLQLRIATSTDVSAVNNIMIRCDRSGNNFVFYPLGINTPSVAVPWDQPFCVEVHRRVDGTFRCWVNDILLQVSQTIPAPPANVLYFGRAQINNTSGGAYCGWDLMDAVVIDPTTPGQQYRPGSSMRVLSSPMNADVTTDWLPPSGVTSSHFSLVSGLTATVDANKVLTGNTVGMRDQYQSGGVTLINATTNKVLSVGIEKRIANAGSVAHSYATELDTGAGPAEIENVTMAGLSGYLYQPVYLDKKPDGSIWTPADLATLKAGIKVKS